MSSSATGMSEPSSKLLISSFIENGTDPAESDSDSLENPLPQPVDDEFVGDTYMS